MFDKKNPLWMAIINLSPDSFSDSDPTNSTKKTTEKCLEFVANGAHIIDFGGVATNPNVTNIAISPEKELSRIYTHIKEARKVLPKNILISVDTFSPKVAYTLAKEKLIDIINDIYAAQNQYVINGLNLTTAHVAAEFNLGLILMHMNSPCDNSPILPMIIKFLTERLSYCKEIGVKNLIIDPGIGYGRFGKTFKQILELLSQESMTELCKLGVPLLIGLSRKAFHLDLDPTLINPLSRDKLSKEIELRCIQYGAHIIRTHNMNKV